MSDEVDTKLAIELSPEMRKLIVGEVNRMAEDGLDHLGVVNMPALNMICGAIWVMELMGVDFDDEELPSVKKLQAAIISQALIDAAGSEPSFRSEVKRS